MPTWLNLQPLIYLVVPIVVTFIAPHFEHVVIQLGGAPGDTSRTRLRHHIMPFVMVTSMLKSAAARPFLRYESSAFHISVSTHLSPKE